MKSYLLARLPYLFFVVAWIAIKIVRLIPFAVARPHSSAVSKTSLIIEAGERGWASIEFKELYQSGVEFLGDDRVSKLVIDKSKPYFPQVRSAVIEQRPTHYLYDPRTGAQEYGKGLIESICLGFLFARHGVVPIVLLTDLSYRIWRCKSAAVSATSGVVVTFMAPKKVQPIFPHRRLAGPSLMPFSQKLLRELTAARKTLVKTGDIADVVRFTGSLYEPRTSFLNELEAKLKDEGIKLEILGRELGSQRVSDEEYWNRLASCRLVVTTAVQAAQPGIDWEWVPHLVYRYLEVMAAGNALLAPTVPCIERYFRAGVHYVPFDSLESAVSAASYYHKHPRQLEAIRKAGQKRATELIAVHSFWVQIDTALGYEALSAA